MDDYFNFKTAPFVVVDRLPCSKMGTKIFFKIQDDDLNFSLSRMPLTEQENEDIEQELEMCKGKIYCVLTPEANEMYIYGSGKWHLIDRHVF